MSGAASEPGLRSLEMHSKRRYKICICSVVLGQLESLRNYQGFGIIFPKIHLDPENENFSDSSLHRIFESETFISFLFLRKIA